MNIAAIILARGGSKGIPKKNLVPFCGQPLIYWSINQAVKARQIDTVWVSSDSDEILEFSKANGSRVIKRPAEHASDSASSESAWLHAIDFIEKEDDRKLNAIVGIQPTSVLREYDDFDKAISQFQEHNCDSMFSANLLEDYCVWRQTERIYESVSYDYKNRKRRQAWSHQYLENGSFYIFKPEIIRDLQNRLGGKIDTYVMKKYQAFQIDDLEDLKFCETLMKAYLLS